MTELEEKFYKTFEIEERDCQTCISTDGCPTVDCKNCQYLKIVKLYPPITDHILLELVCILAKSDFYGYYPVYSKNFAELKERILNVCIKRKSAVATHIRELFEG